MGCAERGNDVKEKERKKHPNHPKPPPPRTVGEEGSYLFPLMVTLLVGIIFLGGVAVGLGMRI